MNRTEPREDHSIYDARYAKLRAEGKTGWVDRNSGNWEVHLGALERLLASEFRPKAGRALDLGCGAGCWSFVLADNGFDVTGVDLSQNAIDWANDRAAERGPGEPGSVAFLCARATDLNWLPLANFDFVLDGFLLHCLIGGDRPAYLAAVRRCLKPDGAFFVQSFCAEDLSAPEWRDWKIDPVSRYQLDEAGRAMKYVGNRASILGELAAAGFTVLDEWTVPIAGGMLQVVCSCGTPV